MPGKGRVVLRDAPHPLPSHVRVGDPHIERIVADGNSGALHFRMAQGVMPVKEVMQLDTLAWHDFGCLVPRAGKRRHHELLIVEDTPMGARSTQLQTGHIRFTRRDAKWLMSILIVDL